jgi:hypothetical protein
VNVLHKGRIMNLEFRIKNEKRKDVKNEKAKVKKDFSPTKIVGFSHSDSLGRNEISSH